MSQSYKRLIIKAFVILIISFLNAINVNAACTYVEKANLNEVASKVKTNYEIIEKTETYEVLDTDVNEVFTHEAIKSSFKINIYNITKDLYVTQHNGFNNEDTNIFFEDTENGIYTFLTDDLENIINFKYDIYSNLENCTGDILKTYNFIKPKLNLYSQHGACDGLEDIPYCKKYITEDLNIEESEISRRVEEYLASKNTQSEQGNNKKNIIETLKENYIYVILGVGIVAGALTTTIIIVKKRSAL